MSDKQMNAGNGGSTIVGSIYILTNPSTTFVKIGYADNVPERVRVLNSSESLPYSFRIYATYDVPVRLADKKLHAIIDQLNPELRAIEVKDGKTRTREFYAMSPEAAYNLLKALAELHGFEDRLHLWEESADDKKNAENAEKTMSAKKRLEAFRFSAADVPIGAEILFVGDKTKTATVVNDRKVRYEGKEYSLSALALLLTGKEGTLQGPLYFEYEGEVLTERRKRMLED